MIVYLQKEWFPRGTYHKLKYKKIHPYKILIKSNDNAYKVDLQPALDISPMFNVSELYTFHGDSVGDESEEGVD